MSLSLSQRIKNAYPSFSKGQKKIAATILNDYDKVAYLTAAKLGKLVGVSESTVVRFANELGYEGYAEFLRAVQELIRSKLTPNQRIEITKQHYSKGSVLHNVMESDIAKIRYTMENLKPEEFSAAVDAVIAAEHIYVFGARSTQPIAQLLNYNLSLMFDNVRFVRPTSTAEIFEQMYSIGEKDVLIAFSFPRYSSKMVNAVKYSKQKGTKIIAFTDSDASPLAEHATYLLPAQSDMASFMDSLIAPISIINAMVVEISTRKERELKERFDTLEKYWEEYHVYEKR